MIHKNYQKINKKINCKLIIKRIKFKFKMNKTKKK